MENWFREEKGLKLGKSGIMGHFPKPGDILLSKINKRASNIGIIGNKTAVEVGKAKE